MRCIICKNYFCGRCPRNPPFDFPECPTNPGGQRLDEIDLQILRGEINHA